MGIRWTAGVVEHKPRVETGSEITPPSILDGGRQTYDYRNSKLWG